MLWCHHNAVFHPFVLLGERSEWILFTKEQANIEYMLPFRLRCVVDGVLV